ncbi:MAG: ATP-dependent zinc protease [Candidatus Marinimicrobia bacterium]|nr:ATP-dependent zinc protease [Candidatus Neomarinimicrobiota bacterium]|tara:strand:+ start:342 stop:788 length:447 start_codon:yes stop_codon:yes gene_type:complete
MILKRPPKAKKNSSTIHIGWREWISFPNYGGFRLKAKIDTGATLSALHATHIEEFKKRSGLWVRFRVYQAKNFITVEKPILKYRNIRNSFGESQKRPMVKMEIQLGDHSWETNVSLTQRSGMIYPMLIGRNSLRKKYIIHPKQSFLLI